MRVLVYVIGCFLFSASAIAADAIQIDVAKADVRSQKTLVISTINGDEKYSEMTQESRADVMSRLDRISEMLPDGHTIAALDAEKQRAVASDQEAINKLLAKAFRDSRLVCTREIVLGSNMLKRICKTAAARSRDNDIVRNNGIKVSN